MLLAAGCGGGDGGGGGDTGPATPGERKAAGQLKFCFEGAGALTASPGQSIPVLDRTPEAPASDDAKRIMVAYWAATGGAVHLYYAPDAAAADRAAEDLDTEGLLRQGQLIGVPDENSPPNEDEALLASDCLY